MEYIKDIFLEENEEELAVLNFNIDADLTKDVPWDMIQFRAETLIKGSTILKFSLKFKEPPKNPRDASIYRLIEILIKTIVENLKFLKPIKGSSQTDDEVYLTTRFKVDIENILEEKIHSSVIQEVLKELRKTIKICSEENPTNDSIKPQNITPKKV